MGMKSAHFLFLVHRASAFKKEGSRSGGGIFQRITKILSLFHHNKYLSLLNSHTFPNS